MHTFLLVKRWPLCLLLAAMASVTDMAPHHHQDLLTAMASVTDVAAHHHQAKELVIKLDSNSIWPERFSLHFYASDSRPIELVHMCYTISLTLTYPYIHTYPHFPLLTHTLIYPHWTSTDPHALILTTCSLTKSYTLTTPSHFLLLSHPPLNSPSPQIHPITNPPMYSLTKPPDSPVSSLTQTLTHPTTPTPTFTRSFTYPPAHSPTSSLTNTITHPQPHSPTPRLSHAIPLLSITE